MSLFDVLVLTLFFTSISTFVCHFFLAFIFGFVLKKSNPSEFKGLYLLGFPYSFWGLYSYTSTRALRDTPHGKNGYQNIYTILGFFL